MGSAVSATTTVRMYSRRTCGLCEKARSVILDELGRQGFHYEEVFIDDDDGLESEYGLRVPVVVVNGFEEFEYTVEPGRLRELLAH
jgi:glutaredoxin